MKRACRIVPQKRSDPPTLRANFRLATQAAKTYLKTKEP
jgi:hypothetical protein